MITYYVLVVDNLDKVYYEKIYGGHAQIDKYLDSKSYWKKADRSHSVYEKIIFETVIVV